MDFFYSDMHILPLQRIKHNSSNIVLLHPFIFKFKLPTLTTIFASPKYVVSSPDNKNRSLNSAKTSLLDWWDHSPSIPNNVLDGLDDKKWQLRYRVQRWAHQETGYEVAREFQGQYSIASSHPHWCLSFASSPHVNHSEYLVTIFLCYIYLN